MQEHSPLSFEIQSKVDRWLKSPFDITTQECVRDLLKHNTQKLIDAFYTNLSFGTAGLRGLMGVGTNRINRYTIAAATQGLANYILKVQNNKQNSVAIAYDCRHHSEEFAKEAASVLAANGIQVFLSQQLRPTPFLSFVCRYRRCIAAIMITASHNPPEYNGYKVYWDDGAQIVPPHDKGIIEEVRKIIDISSVKKAPLSHPLIHYLDISDDKAYLKEIIFLQNLPKENQREGHLLQIVFSNLHGTGITLLPEALKSWGFTNLRYVEEEKEPNGDFPTAKKPNPELKEALQLGIELLLKTKSDLLIATDPDADRVGVAIQKDGKETLLNGNQIASICLYHLLETLQKQNRLSKQYAVVSTIVTTPLLKDLCKAYQVHYFETLTGFKYIGEKIREFEESLCEYEFLFGAEESFGFLYGTHARDKDAIITSCLLSEIALEQKKQGKTLIDLLYSIYQKFGVYQDRQLSINLPDGEKSQALIEKAMQSLRNTPQKKLDNKEALFIEDYLLSIKKDLKTDKETPLLLPKSNVLVYQYEDGSKFVIRPSGTESKIKIYGMVKQKTSQPIFSSITSCNELLKRRLEEIKTTYLRL